MKRNINFLPEVEEDLISAYLWYEEKSKGLGEDFLRIFYASSSEIERNPQSYQKVYNNYRRKIIKRFPYSVYYLVKRYEVIVYGVFHTARNPKAIEDVLKKR